MRVVVTGGAGFIGANLCRALAESGNDVVALDDLSTGSRRTSAASTSTLVEGTILDPETLDAAMHGADAVVHLAARPSVPRSIADPVATHLANATGTVQVLEAARARRPVPGRPSPRDRGVVVVGLRRQPDAAQARGPRHRAAEPVRRQQARRPRRYALAYQHSFGLPVLAFRFFNVFGRCRRPATRTPRSCPLFAAAALAGRPLIVHGDGRQSRDFTYVGTVAAVIADAIARRVTHPEAGEPRLRHPHRDPRAHRAMLEELVGHAARDRAHRGARRRRAALAERLRPDCASCSPTSSRPICATSLRATLDWFRARSMTKRAFDLIGASVLLVLLSPVIAVVACGDHAARRLGRCASRRARRAAA